MRVIELQHLRGDERGIEAVAQRIRAYCSDDEPQHARLLAAREGNRAEAYRPEHRHADPNQSAKYLHVTRI